MDYKAILFVIRYTLSKILTLIKLNKGYPLVVIDNDGTLFGIISMEISLHL